MFSEGDLLGWFKAPEEIIFPAVSAVAKAALFDDDDDNAVAITAVVVAVAVAVVELSSFTATVGMVDVIEVVRVLSKAGSMRCARLSRSTKGVDDAFVDAPLDKEPSCNGERGKSTISLPPA